MRWWSSGFGDVQRSRMVLDMSAQAADAMQESEVSQCYDGEQRNSNKLMSMQNQESTAHESLDA